MTDQLASSFVRQDLVPERPAPVATTGFIGFVRTRMFNTPSNAILTIVSALLLWFTVIPTVKFLLVDAVWQGSDRNACLAENVGRAVGACWPFVHAKLTQFIYGFYPEAERWRVNAIFLLAVVLLVPLLIPRIPAKSANAGLFFLAFPVIAYFLLHGGGIRGFALTWTADMALALANSIADAGRKLAELGDAKGAIGLVPALLGKRLVLLGGALAIPIAPLGWLRDWIQASGRPV